MKNLAKCGCGKVLKEFGEAEGLSYVCGECAKKRAVYTDTNKVKVIKGGIRRDPEEIIKEIGAKKLSETASGRTVLENARHKYRAELIQPHEPEFNKYWGKQQEKIQRDMADLRAQSQRMKKERGVV